MMMDEVRYHMLRPAQIVKKRNECPIAYIPIGTIEWHGVHNPVGADTLQAEGIAIQCAMKGGGLVFPPLYYGESRVEALMESSPDVGGLIAKEMDLPPDNFKSENIPFSPIEQVMNYNKLLIHILAEVESLGFKVGVLVAGHYPLIDHARAAVLQFNQRRLNRVDHKMLAWAFVDFLLVKDLFTYAGDHGAGWETSHIMALYPETVDLGILPPKGENVIGVGGGIPPQDSTADFGWKTINSAVDIAIKETHHRLSHPHLYNGHGCWLREGLWRND
jgi:creatinine amidohydrolase